MKGSPVRVRASAWDSSLLQAPWALNRCAIPGEPVSVRRYTVRTPAMRRVRWHEPAARCARSCPTRAHAGRDGTRMRRRSGSAEHPGGAGRAEAGPGEIVAARSARQGRGDPPLIPRASTANIAPQLGAVWFSDLVADPSVSSSCAWRNGGGACGSPSVQAVACE